MPDETYRDHILEHYKNPRNQGVLDPADVDHAEDNPLCGDEVRVTLRLEGGRIADAAFEGRGCAISLAAASLLTERMKGMPVAEVAALAKEDVVALLGVPVSPVRLKCAMLPLVAAQRGLGDRRPPAGDIL